MDDVEGRGGRFLGSHASKEDRLRAWSSYLHFKDVDDIVNHLNAATLKRLAKALEAVKNGAGPEDTLHRYAQAYVAFVEKNRNLWDAMFKYRRSDSGAVPGWYRAVIEELVVPVKRCFEEIAPPKTPGASAQAAKMTWASLTVSARSMLRACA